MLEGVYGCFMTCNVFLAGNSEVSLELQCFTAELITYIVCECDAPECRQQYQGLFCYLFHSDYCAAALARNFTAFMLLTNNDSSVYVPTASSTLLFFSSVVGSLRGSAKVLPRH